MISLGRLIRKSLLSYTDVGGISSYASSLLTEIFPSTDMPAKTTIFDHRVNVLHDFGTSPRNYVSYNPQGRLMMIAGFGNLSGAVDIWDRKTLTKEASYNASNTSYTDWSPDGRFLLCATLSPRMRVDNGVRILHWSGSLVFEEAVDELYQVGLVYRLLN